jgi:hypothetical protein
MVLRCFEGASWWRRRTQGLIRRRVTSMQFGFRLVPHWPALAWLAEVSPGNPRATVFHGPKVETRDAWFCEAVWAGDFDAGDFDRTDQIFGSGARIRDEKLIFVSAGATTDRLVSMRLGERWIVSNSLACVLERAEATVDATFPRYRHFFGTILRGFEEVDRDLPTSAGPVRLTYYKNLAWDGATLTDQDKPQTCDGFASFEEYREFLRSAARGLASNLSAQRRERPFKMLGTLSSGYDSACVSTIVREFGLRDVISFSHSKTGKSDTGETVASALGFKTNIVDRDAWRSGHLSEASFVSSDAKGEDVYFYGAEDLLRGCAVFTGFQGGKLWEKHTKLGGEHLLRTDRSGLSLTEYRLRAGFLHCPLPFLGARHVDAVSRISTSAEMAPWDIGGDYTKPIARRIVEWAGVAREAFGMEKKAASVVFHSARNMLSPSTQADFSQWLRDHTADFWRCGAIPPDLRDALLSPMRWCARRGWALFDRTKSSTGAARSVRDLSRRIAEWGDKERLSLYLFPWAMHHAKAAYRFDHSADEIPSTAPLAQSNPGKETRNAVRV